MEEHGWWRPLGELLVERDLISQEQLEQALAEQAQSGRRLGEIIVAAGLVSRERLTQVLLEQCGLDLSTQDGFGSGLRGQLWPIRGRLSMLPTEEVQSSQVASGPASRPCLSLPVRVS